MGKILDSVAVIIALVALGIVIITIGGLFYSMVPFLLAHKTGILLVIVSILSFAITVWAFNRAETVIKRRLQK